MKILLLGKNGQVGWELQRSLACLGELIALGSDSRAFYNNLSRPDELSATVRALRPDVIVNAAAHTAVDKAEGEPDRATLLNATAPAVLAREAQALGAWLVHYSTDYVFDGSGDSPWRESDPTGPVSVYGTSKLAGEQAIQATAARHLILRTSWVYGARGGNFAKTMVRLAREREALTVIDDQFGAPTAAELLADVTAHAVRQALRDERAAGLYHVAAAGETTWHGYACLVLETVQGLGMALKAGPQHVRAVPTSGFPTPARRPNNSRLDTHKFRETFGLQLPPWQDGVRRMLSESFTPAS